MLINFTCHECESQFRITEQELYDLETLGCPVCKKKVSKTFIRQIKGFIVESNSNPFDISFSSSPTISTSKIINRAISYCAALHKDLELKSLNDLSSALKTDQEADILTRLLEGTILAYHMQLSQSLKLVGIDIGVTS